MHRWLLNLFLKVALPSRISSPRKANSTQTDIKHFFRAIVQFNFKHNATLDVIKCIPVNRSSLIIKNKMDFLFPNGEHSILLFFCSFAKAESLQKIH